MDFSEQVLEEGLNQVLVIAKERTKTLELLKQALLDGDSQKIFVYASKLCGLAYESIRISQGVDAGAGRG